MRLQLRSLSLLDEYTLQLSLDFGSERHVAQPNLRIGRRQQTEQFAPGLHHR
jgi:hypothetical protein